MARRRDAEERDEAAAVLAGGVRGCLLIQRDMGPHFF